MELSPENTPLQPVSDIPFRLQITVGTIIWLSIGLLAAVLRLGRLGLAPLAPAEAVEAWRVWLFWSPNGSVLLDSYSPAYFSLTSLLTQIAGFSDVTIRLVPAAAGVAAVVLLYRWRPLLGTLGSLVAAFWVAISPLLVFQSRQAGGASLAMLALVIVGGVLWQTIVEPATLTRRSLLVAVAAAAVGLATTTLFYSGILTMALAILWADRSMRPSSQLQSEESGSESWVGRGQIWRILVDRPDGHRAILVTAAVSFLLASTLFLWHLPGLGETANIAAGWVLALRNALLTDGWIALFTQAARYELLLFLPALITAVWAVWAAPPVGRALALWFGAAVLLSGLQNSSPTLLASVVLPAAVLIGYAAEQLRQVVSRQGDSYWIGAVQVAGLLTILLLIVAANLGRYARLSFFDPADVAHLLLALLCLLIALFLWALVTVWDPPLGLTAGMMTLFLAALIVQWGIGWRVGVSGIFDGRIMPSPLITADEFPLFIQTTAETARELRGAEQAVSLFSAIDHPLLRWYLRDYDRAKFGAAVPVEATYDLIITPNVSEPAFGADYIGSDFGIMTPVPPAPTEWLARLRYFLFTQRPPPQEEIRVVLWVRSDLLLRDDPSFP